MNVFAARRLPAVLAALVMLPLAAPLRAQDNVLDLRVEWSGERTPLYQNFLYARTLAGGRWMVQGLVLRLPADKYDELAVGGGYRVASMGGASAYVIAGFGDATDARYWEPALLVQRTQGKLTGSFFVQRYTPADARGVVQWLVDPLEAQYAVAGPFAVGASLYAYRADGGDWSTRFGPKVSLSDRHGATEVRLSEMSPGSRALQLRRVILF
jgi:hypothetical protein